MTHSKLTLWIENAEARNFSEAAMFERNWVATESHFLHLGEAIAKVPSSLAAFGSHALAYVRHPLSRTED